MARCALVYHFAAPDPVVSARQFSDLARGLSETGHDVTVFTSNRIWGSPDTRLPREERDGDVRILRLPRPAWSQGRALSRLANSTWMLSGWLPDIVGHGPFDNIVLGTDPAFAPLLAPLLRTCTRSKLVHWAFDLFPEAIAADSPAFEGTIAYRAAEALMGRAYRSFDALVDIGPCMRRRLAAYAPEADFHTIVPWPLVEPSSPREDRSDLERTRRELFGQAELGLLYAGTLGRAHEFEALLKLAREARAAFGDRVAFCFAGRGARFAELEAALQPSDTNVRVAPFCDEAELERRLGAADVHVVSLREGWEGIVVPSKYFASLAMQKPVLVTGSVNSSPAVWTEEEGCGLVLGREDGLHWLRELLDDRGALEYLGRRGRAAYERRFSKAASLSAWTKLLSR